MLLLGWIVAAALFAATWFQFASIQHYSHVAEAISDWEECLLHPQLENHLHQHDHENAHVVACAVKMDLLLEVKDMDPLVYWEHLCEHIEQGETPEEPALIDHVSHDDLHSLRHWAERNEQSRLKSMGRMLFGGTGFLFGILSLTALRLREANYRAEHPLPGLVPICSWCHNIREPDGEWTRVDKYLQHRLGTRFTHTLCPECLEEEMDKLNKPAKDDA